MRAPVIGLVGAVLLGATGCGSNQNFADKPRPAVPITVGASVNAQRVSISPSRVGAGPVNLIVANLSHQSVDVRIEPVDASGPAASSGPINPGGTTSLSFDARTGTYTVGARGGSVRSATLTVGKPRPSSSNEVLLP